MNTLVCYKIVYEDQDIIANPDRTLSFDRAEDKLSLYDLNAVEAGVKIAEATSGTAKALTVGGRRVDNSKLKKGVLSRGLGELFIVKDDSTADADSHATASVLAAAAKKIGFDLILCGEGSADYYSQQVGCQLGELLGLPVINSVNKIIPGDGTITVERTLEDSTEVLEIKLPAVVCVTSDINDPRIPGMKDILAAGKKPVSLWSLADIGMERPEQSLEKISVLAPARKDRKQILFEGEGKMLEFFEKIRGEIL